MAIILNGSTGITTPDLEAATAQVNNVDVVTTTAPQTLTNKTLTNPTINGFTGDTSVINIGSGQFYKDASGNLGIGVTPSAWNVGKALQIGSYGITLWDTGGATKRLAWDDAMNPYLLYAGAWTAMVFVLGCVAGLTYWSWR